MGEHTCLKMKSRKFLVACCLAVAAATRLEDGTVVLHTDHDPKLLWDDTSTGAHAKFSVWSGHGWSTRLNMHNHPQENTRDSPEDVTQLHVSMKDENYGGKPFVAHPLTYSKIWCDHGSGG